MTPTFDDPGRDGTATASVVARAAAALREHTDPGWVDARDRIRSAALSATRRTWPLALQGGGGLYVSDEVVVALLRQTLDAIDRAKPARIFITPKDDPDDLVDLVTIEIVVEYGQPIAPLVDEVRERSLALLADLLAPEPDGPRPPIDVAVVSVAETD